LLQPLDEAETPSDGAAPQKTAAKLHPEQGLRSCLGILSLVRSYGPARASTLVVFAIGALLMARDFIVKLAPLYPAIAGRLQLPVVRPYEQPAE
jgi:hypothetical protein